MMATAFIALITSLGPALLGVVGRVLFTDPRPLRSLKRHAKLLAELPDEAKEPIVELLTTEARTYANRTLRRSQRKLNGGNLGALITVGLFTAGIIYGGSILALQLSWWWWIPTAAIGLFLILLLTFGFKDFWKYPEEVYPRMVNHDDDLSMTQGIALIQETTAARNLLGYGTRALREAVFLDTTRDPVMTILSIGVEKTMKMTLGLAHAAATGDWPPRKMFQSVWRHDLNVMNDEILRTLRERLSAATHPAVVEPLLDEINSNTAWKPLVAALSRYGQSGRFYYLDALAESPQSEDDPSDYWNTAELALLETDPEFKAALYSAASSPSEWDARTTELNVRMSEQIAVWWELVSLAGKHGMLGSRGKSWGFDIHSSMVGRQVRGH